MENSRSTGANRPPITQPCEETIAAIATPVSAGGIGIIRISGEKAPEVAGKIFKSVNGKTPQEMLGYTGMYGRIYDKDGEIDEAVLFVYKAPKSYTGENVVEICCHGGIYLVKKVLRACLEAGARPAEAGEFTKRAFLNGKMSLTQAEAVMELISAQGKQSAQAALSARNGQVYKRINGITEQLLNLSSALAAWVDYPDEEIEEVSEENLKKSVTTICESLKQLLREYDTGKVFSEGVETVIVGRPNVGKSTLMNLLSGEQKSIVTQIPGTTRDIVEDTIRVGDVILHLADTAGLRETDDPIEQMGVELANKKLKSSYLILAVFDSSESMSDDDWELVEKIQDRPVVAVVNKSDLGKKIEIEKLREKLSYVVEVSASEGQGIEELTQAITSLLGWNQLDASAGLLVNERQRACAQEADKTMSEAMEALKAGETLDAINVCVDSAIDSLLSLTGEKASVAVVDKVFERFCVGK